MQHRTVFIVTLTVLAGCAAPMKPEDYEWRLKAASSLDLCLNLGRGPYPGMIAQELQHRHENCEQFAAAMQAQAAQRAAATQAALQYMQMTRPAPIVAPVVPINPSVNCASYRTGNTVQTNCQ